MQFLTLNTKNTANLGHITTTSHFQSQVQAQKGTIINKIPHTETNPFILEKICSMSAETIRAQNQQGLPSPVTPMIKKYKQGTYICLSPLTCTSVTQTIMYKQTHIHANCTNSKG